MEEMKIRRATLDDKEQVLAIRNDVYAGIDYLASFYDHLLCCQNAKAYVGIINGRIITFVVVFLVDDGHTLVTRAGRVSPEYEGKGYYLTFHTYIKRQPGTSENAYTTLGYKLPPSNESTKQTNKPILSKAMNKYVFNPHVPQLIGTTQRGVRQGSNIRTATSADLELYMTSTKHVRYLFPDDVMIINWVPYRLVPSNVPLIGVPGHTHMLTDVDAGNQSGLLSVITVYASRDPGYTANLDIYGSDPKSVEKHIMGQMEFLRKRVNGETCLLVYFEDCLDATIDDVFRGFGLKKNIWRSPTNKEIEFTRQFLFRVPFEVSGMGVSKL